MSSGLWLSGLRARYHRGQDVLHGIDLEAPRGACTALLGPNGSGKSTLLKAVLGLVASEGEIRLDGEELSAASPGDRARRIAYVPQRSQLSSRLAARGVVALGRFAHRRLLGGSHSEDCEAVDRALEECQAAHLAPRPFVELSGGEQQRILLARALATGAEVLLLDEPTSSQDVWHILELHAVLRRLADGGRAVVTVLHDLSEARAHADRVVLLDRGRVHSAGAARELLVQNPVRAVYGVDPIEGAGLGYRRAPTTGSGAE